jgi:hypothetical protein
VELPEDAKRVRALLSKNGTADVQFELYRISATEFSVLENGKSVGVFYRGLAPSRPGAPGLAYSGTYLSISEAFEGCLAKRFPGFTAKDIETASD